MSKDIQLALEAELAAGGELAGPQQDPASTEALAATA